jgi:hypothetical protein
LSGYLECLAAAGIAAVMIGRRNPVVEIAIATLDRNVDKTLPRCDHAIVIGRVRAARGAGVYSLSIGRAIAARSSTPSKNVEQDAVVRARTAVLPVGLSRCARIFAPPTERENSRPEHHLRGRCTRSR